MTQVQLATSGSQTDLTGLTRVTVTDPAAEVASVAFFVIDRDKRRVGPLAADRVLAGGIYEKDAILDIRESTRVESEITLNDGTILRSAPAFFGARYEPLTAAPGILAAFTVTPSASTLTISATLGTAALWKCYARKGSQPTSDGTSATPPSDVYLREWDASELSFQMAADPGAWNLIAVGYNSAGQSGPQLTATAQVTS